MAAACAAVLALAGCSYSTIEPPAESPAWQTVDTGSPAATLAPIAAPTSGTSGNGDPAPQVSVEITTQPPDTGDGSGGEGGVGHVERSVIAASAAYASQLVSLANGARADAGVGKLRVDTCARQAALARAKRALAKAHLEHEPLPNCGNGWVGENLARHYGSAADMHAAWMGSAGHRENILRAEFTGIGVGCVAYSRRDPHQVATRADDVGGHVCAEVFVG